MSTALPANSYPATLGIDYETEPRQRLSVLLRFFYALPIAVVLGLIGGNALNFSTNGDTWQAAGTGGGILVLPTVLMILFRQKYPRWWFDFNREYVRFSMRVGAYMALLTDRYPSTDEEQSVHLDFAYPDVPSDLNRWLPLVKWFLAIPHYFVLVFLGIAAFAVTVIAWFAILFTGTYPAGMHGFVVGVARWGLRVQAYAFLLVTDRYPPFSLQD